MNKADLLSLERLEKQVAESKENRARYAGAITELEKQLVANHQLDSVDMANNKLAELQEQKDGLVTEREDLFKRLKDEYGWEC